MIHPVFYFDTGKKALKTLCQVIKHLVKVPTYLTSAVIGFRKLFRYLFILCAEISPGWLLPLLLPGNLPLLQQSKRR